MDTVDYIAEAQRQLSHHNYYGSVPENFTSRHMKLIQSTVYNIYQQGEIDEKCKEYLADIIACVLDY